MRISLSVSIWNRALPNTTVLRLSAFGLQFNVIDLSWLFVIVAG
jgi:hypothetical protein